MPKISIFDLRFTVCSVQAWTGEDYYQLLCKWVLNIVLILACSSTFQKEIHFIQTFRERKFPKFPSDFFTLSNSLLLFWNAWHQQPPWFERVNLGRVSHWSAVLAYRAGSVLLKKFVSLAQVRMLEARKLMLGSIREPEA